LTDFADKTSKSFNSVLDFSFTQKAENFIAGIESIAIASKEKLQPALKDNAVALEKFNGITFDNVVSAMSEAGNKIKITANSIASTVNSSIVNGIGGAFSAMGGALAKGENAWESFGKSILKSLGQLLMFFGNMLIAIGIGLSTVPFLFGLQGPAAIAAGIAATVLGGALMALGGGGGGTSPQAGGGVAGGSTEAPSQPGQIQTLASTANQQAQTQVQLVVQGNILDRRATGLELVEVLNEAFGSQGVVVTG
jgi:hypothetical protein